MTPYDDAFMRAHADALRAEDTAAWDDFRAHHRPLPDLDDDTAANLATWVTTHRPDRATPLYPRKVTPCATTITPNASPATTRLHVSTRSIDGLPPMTVFASFPGSWSCRASLADSASSRGPSTSSGRPWPGARIARLLWFGLTTWECRRWW